MYKPISLLVLLFWLATGSMWGQNIQVIMSPKPSPYISDWQDRTETLRLMITNTSTKEMSVKIKSEIFNGSGAIVADVDVAKMPVLVIPPGVSTFNPEDIIPTSAVRYQGSLQKTTLTTGRIPDDNYKLCVALVDPKTGAPVGTSGTVCKMFTIIDFQAPILQMPKDKGTILDFEARGIMFRWTPVSPTPQGVVTYRLQVFEVLPGQSTMTAFRSNQPIVEKDLKGQLQTQWPVEFQQPEAGKEYVWTVTALDNEGRKLVDGAGYAQPFGFSIGKQDNNRLTLKGPVSLEKLSDSEPITFTWEATDKIGPFTLRIIELKGSESPKEAMFQSPLVEIEDIRTTSYSYPLPDKKLLPGKKYAWQVTSGNSKSDIRLFSILPGILIEYSLKVKCSEKYGFYAFILSVNNMNAYAVNLISLPIISTIPTSTTTMVSPSTFPIALPVGNSTISGTISSGGILLTNLCLRPKVAGPAPDDARHEINVCDDSIAICRCSDCDSMTMTFNGFQATPSGSAGNQFNLTGNIQVNRPIYGYEIQMQSMTYSVSPSTCSNGVAGVEQSGVFFVPGSTINGSSSIMIFNETSGLSSSNNQVSKDIKYVSISPINGNVPVNLLIGVPGPLTGISPDCCKIKYEACIKVKVYYEKGGSCKSCVFTKCVQFHN